jgi:MFS family permease
MTAPASTAARPAAPAEARPRDTALPFLVAFAAFFSLLAGANLPAPLYAVYRERFGFSSALLTLVFATYALVLVPSLVLFGQLSDRLGRRRVIAGGLFVALLALAVFAAARSIAWLFAARALQGLAVGAISGAATAALVELEPRGDRRRAALLAGLAQAGGSASGALVAGAMAAWLPAPRVLCYLVWAGVTVVAAAGVLWLPEPSQPAGSWRLQLPRLPHGSLAGFLRASLTAACVWAVAAMFLSVVPSYSGRLLSTHDLALLAAISASMLIASCAAQALSMRRALTPPVAQALGLALLVCGLAALVAAFPLHALALLLAAAALTGAGHGVGFLGAQTEINELAPDRERGAVTAAFVVCIYAGVACAVLGVGLLTERVSLFAAVAALAGAVAAAAVAGGVWNLVARPVADHAAMS